MMGVIKINSMDLFKDFEAFMDDPDVVCTSKTKVGDKFILSFNTDEKFEIDVQKFYNIKKSQQKKYKIITTANDREMFEKYINGYDILAFDIEATGLNVRKDKTIGFSVSGKEGTGLYYPIYSYSCIHGLVELSENKKHFRKYIKMLEGKKLITSLTSFLSQ